MGQVVVEIPQAVYANYVVDDSDVSERLLDDLEPYSRPPVRSDVIAPSNSNRRRALDEVLGIWADREDSAQEIAHQIREKNRKVT
jgi:hypothetical protein